MKPADQELLCFQKRVYGFEKKVCTQFFYLVEYSISTVLDMQTEKLSFVGAGFPRALEIMENLEITKKYHAWKNHGKIMEFEIN